MATITAGAKVQYTNRKGDVIAAEVLHILPAEVFGQELAVVEFLDGPAKGMEMRVKPAALVLI